MLERLTYKWTIGNGKTYGVIKNSLNESNNIARIKWKTYKDKRKFIRRQLIKLDRALTGFDKIEKVSWSGKIIKRLEI